MTVRRENSIAERPVPDTLRTDANALENEVLQTSKVYQSQRAGSQRAGSQRTGKIQTKCQRGSVRPLSQNDLSKSGSLLSQLSSHFSLNASPLNTHPTHPTHPTHIQRPAENVGNGRESSRTNQTKSRPSKISKCSECVAERVADRAAQSLHPNPTSTKVCLHDPEPSRPLPNLPRQLSLDAATFTQGKALHFGESRVRERLRSYESALSQGTKEPPLQRSQSLVASRRQKLEAARSVGAEDPEPAVVKKAPSLTENASDSVSVEKDGVVSRLTAPETYLKARRESNQARPEDAKLFVSAAPSVASASAVESLETFGVTVGKAGVREDQLSPPKSVPSNPHPPPMSADVAANTSATASADVSANASADVSADVSDPHCASVSDCEKAARDGSVTCRGMRLLGSCERLRSQHESEEQKQVRKDKYLDFLYNKRLSRKPSRKLLGVCASSPSLVGTHPKLSVLTSNSCSEKSVTSNSLHSTPLHSPLQSQLQSLESLEGPWGEANPHGHPISSVPPVYEDRWVRGENGVYVPRIFRRRLCSALDVPYSANPLLATECNRRDLRLAWGEAKYFRKSSIHHPQSTDQPSPSHSALATAESLAQAAVNESLPPHLQRPPHLRGQNELHLSDFDPNLSSNASLWPSSLVSNVEEEIACHSRPLRRKKIPIPGRRPPNFSDLYTPLSPSLTPVLGEHPEVGPQIGSPGPAPEFTGSAPFLGDAERDARGRILGVRRKRVAPSQSKKETMATVTGHVSTLPTDPSAPISTVVPILRAVAAGVTEGGVPRLGQSSLVFTERGICSSIQDAPADEAAEVLEAAA